MIQQMKEKEEFDGLGKSRVAEAVSPWENEKGP